LKSTEDAWGNLTDWENVEFRMFIESS